LPNTGLTYLVDRNINKKLKEFWICEKLGGEMSDSILAVRESFLIV
jgi:hypothetical protein